MRRMCLNVVAKFFLSTEVVLFFYFCRSRSPVARTHAACAHICVSHSCMPTRHDHVQSEHNMLQGGASHMWTSDGCTIYRSAVRIGGGGMAPHTPALKSKFCNKNVHREDQSEDPGEAGTSLGTILQHNLQHNVQHNLQHNSKLVRASTLGQ